MDPNETTVDPNTDDLDAFNELLNGTAKEKVAESEPKVDATEDEDALATPAVTPEDDENEEVDNPEPDETLLQTQKPKLTARERIEQLNAKYREEERARQEAERRLAELEAKATTNTPATPETTAAKGPSPDDVNQDGTAKYELGEFDPKFVSDLADFRVEQRMKSYEEDRARREQEAARAAAEDELKADWANRLSETEQSIPDIREKAASLEPVFASVDPTVGEYLALTLMTLDNGPEVLAYLADNVAEARKIVSSTPQAATIALGRLDALVKAPKAAPVKKVTNAPEPPPAPTRGSGGRFEVAGDTDDLEAFERMFYGKK